ncbi:MAG: formylglycine-generating enzyme family protein [Deltaproteobacteria bacterium]|nr:formylglycine-generating enzyme family protein [Deltaproteobacteria bacterium]
MTDLVSDFGIELVKIEPGSFMMGSDFDTLATIMQKIMMADTTWAAEASGEWPRHPVTISRGFYLARFPVTNKILRAVMPEESVAGIDQHPALFSWERVESFLRAINAKSRDLNYRLPTEAEWEYCCKAGTGFEFLHGNDHDDHEGLIVDGTFMPEIESYFKAVGSSGKNGWGIFDMLGNVPEWCSDYYDPDYYLHSPAIDPVNRILSESRVTRGGSLYFNEGYPAPYRASARCYIDCCEDLDPGRDEDDEFEEEYQFLEQAALRLIASEKQE